MKRVQKKLFINLGFVRVLKSPVQQRYDRNKGFPKRGYTPVQLDTCGDVTPWAAHPTDRIDLILFISGYTINKNMQPPPSKKTKKQMQNCWIWPLSCPYYSEPAFYSGVYS